MPTSAAERTRKYRAKIKADPEKYLAAKAKDRACWKIRREMGKVKTIAELTPREKRARRRYWHDHNIKRKARRQQRATSPATTSTAAATPTPMPHPSHQKQRGQKTKRRDRASAYRRIDSLKDAIAKLTKQKEKYRKQTARAKKSNKVVNQGRRGQGASPRKCAKELLTKNTRKVHRELTFHYAVLHQLRQKYREKSTAKAQVLSKVFGKANILNKYRCIQRAKQEFGFSRKAMKSNRKRNNTDLCYEKTKRKTVVTHEVKQKITDNVGRPTA